MGASATLTLDCGRSAAFAGYMSGWSKSLSGAREYRRRRTSVIRAATTKIGVVPKHHNPRDLLVDPEQDQAGNAAEEQNGRPRLHRPRI